MILTFQVKSFHVYPHTIAFLGTFVAPVFGTFDETVFGTFVAGVFGTFVHAFFGTFVEAEQVIGAFYNSFYDVDVGRSFIFGTIQGSSCDR
jgi:hypothetical protein